MIISFLVALYFETVHARLGLPELLAWQKLVIGVAITTAGWMLTALLTKTTDQKTLLNFYRKVTPGGPGWKAVLLKARQSGENVEAYLSEKWDMPSSLLGVFLGLLFIYNALFGIGFWLYENTVAAVVTLLVSTISGILLLKMWRKFKVR